MVEFLSALLNFIGRDQAIVKIIFTLVILVFGHLAVKAVKIFLRRLWITRKEELNKKQVMNREESIRYAGFLGEAAVIAISLIYLNVGVTNEIFNSIANFLPKALSAGLIAVLGFIGIKLVSKVGENFLRSSGVQTYFKELGLSRNAVQLIAGAFRAFLYLLLLQVTLDTLGIGNTFVKEFITASSWAVSFMVAALLVYGFKDLFENFAAGIYLKNSRFVRKGEEVNVNGEKGEVRDISLFSTSLDTARGDILITPNSQMMNADLAFKRTKSDVDTLEDIKDYFVAKKPGYTGPASIEMALEVFGYRHDQDEINEKVEESEEETLELKIKDSVEELTNSEVKAAFVEEVKVTDIAAEFKTWFNDGAVVLPKFYKPELFPDAEKSHYVLSVSVEGNEILLIDPSQTDGGVYYVDKEKLKSAMEELEDETKGYMVLAPKGTTAYWRIKNDLIYSDKTYYNELSKTLEARLRKIMRQGRLLKDATPSSIDRYLERWRSEQEVTRLWAPEEDDNDQTSENN